jgi:NMD protein affecting ribosome stability and mRNA decay
MKTQRGGFRMLQREQRLRERVHDSYKSKGKLSGPAHCPDCGAIHRHGRWSWGAAEPGSQAQCCPACHRIRDRFPAGYVTLQGEFLQAHRDEILKRVRSCEDAEKAEHPLRRIIAIDKGGEGLLVTTTDPFLARRIGEVLHDAYKGKLDTHYNEEENLLRVFWRR